VAAIALARVSEGGKKPGLVVGVGGEMIHR
jgi:hypothetical protein